MIKFIKIGNLSVNADKIIAISNSSSKTGDKQYLNFYIENYPGVPELSFNSEKERDLFIKLHFEYIN